MVWENEEIYILQNTMVDKLNYQAIVDRQNYGMQLVIKGGVIVLGVE